MHPQSILSRYEQRERMNGAVAGGIAAVIDQLNLGESITMGPAEALQLRADAQQVVTQLQEELHDDLLRLDDTNKKLQKVLRKPLNDDDAPHVAVRIAELREREKYLKSKVAALRRRIPGELALIDAWTRQLLARTTHGVVPHLGLEHAPPSLVPSSRSAPGTSALYLLLTSSHVLSLLSPVRFGRVE